MTYKINRLLKRRRIHAGAIVFALLLVIPLLGTAQKKKFAALFYNVENFFDYTDDTLTNDKEFSPGGMRGWNQYRFYDKRNKIAKVLIASGRWEMPSLIGLAEVENRYCVEQLVYDSPLKPFRYSYIHKESPDRRGIDVVLLYKPERFEPLDTQFLEVNFPSAPEKTTRDILYAKGIVNYHDTLHVFVNHWPSRWGGQLESQPKRIAAAKTLRKKVLKIHKENSRANVLIMGDFNDYPTNKSIAAILGAETPESNARAGKFYNLSRSKSGKSAGGSYKYKGEWGMLDQMIVSGSLLQKDKTFYTTPANHKIINFPFLLEKDEKYVGERPARTFVGYRYHGGFSDHLPVYLDFILK